MAKKITELPTLATADNDDLIPIVDISGSVTKKVTASGLGAAVAAGLPNSSISPSKLNIAPTSNATANASSITTASTTYISGTSSTSVAIGVNGLALVFIQSDVASNSDGTQPCISFTASGSNTIVADDEKSVSLTRASSSGAEIGTASGAFLLSGLAAGNTTFTLAVKRYAGTGNAIFRKRSITVIPF